MARPAKASSRMCSNPVSAKAANKMIALRLRLTIAS